MDGVIGLESGMFPYRYVVLTFEPIDVTDRVGEKIANYIEDNGLMDEIVDDAVDWLRDYFDCSTDPYWWAIENALVSHIGMEKLDELDEEGVW